MVKEKRFLVYSTHNENKSVIAEKLIRAPHGKIYKKMTANNSKFYLLSTANFQCS